MYNFLQLKIAFKIFVNFIVNSDKLDIDTVTLNTY